MENEYVWTCFPSPIHHNDVLNIKIKMLKMAECKNVKQIEVQQINFSYICIQTMQKCMKWISKCQKKCTSPATEFLFNLYKKLKETSKMYKKFGNKKIKSSAD